MRTRQFARYLFRRTKIVGPRPDVSSMNFGFEFETGFYISNWYKGTNRTTQVNSIIGDTGFNKYYAKMTALAT